MIFFVSDCLRRRMQDTEKIACLWLELATELGAFWFAVSRFGDGCNSAGGVMRQ
jgi:hypothetical protein